MIDVNRRTEAANHKQVCYTIEKASTITGSPFSVKLSVIAKLNY